MSLRGSRAKDGRQQVPCVAYTGTQLRMKTLSHVDISALEHHKSDNVQQPMLPLDANVLEEVEECARQPASRKCVFAYEDKYTFARILVADSLVFDSHFESGNLHSAFRVIPDDVKLARSKQIYDLYMHNDVYTNGHTQWFYFSVSNVRRGDEVTFYIKNFSKNDSLFNSGMRPLLFSTKSGKGWERCGTNIAYFPTVGPGQQQNQQQQQQQQQSQQQPTPPPPQEAAGASASVDAQLAETGTAQAPSSTSSTSTDQASSSAKPAPAPKKPASTNYTLAFTHTFEHNEDVCYFAYCHPYTYTDLQTYLHKLQQDGRRRKNGKMSLLCKTIAGNNCDLLTITAPSQSADVLRARVVIFLTARVHPGESNASWIMQGMIDFLTSDSSEAVQLRERFIFKVIPMLNPDGVVNGNYRTSLSGVDLNRKWSHPDPQKHPTIYNTKELIRRISCVWQVGLVLDVHGHSRKQGAFFYGCVPDRKIMRPPSPPYYLAARDQSNAEALGGGLRAQDAADVLTLFSSLDAMAISPPLPLSSSEHAEESQQKATSWTISTDPLRNPIYPNKSCTLRDVLAWRVKLLPRVLDATVPLFSLESCSFKMQKGKASTMRMVAFTELGVDCVYTIEASLAGKMPFHFGAGDLINLGRELCNSLLTIYPSLAPRSCPLYDVPIPPSARHYSCRESLSMFASEMNYWKQLYTIETAVGSGASLLSDVGLLEVTAKEDSTGLGRIDENAEDSDKESLAEPPPPPAGTPIDVSLSSKRERKDKGQGKLKSAAKEGLTAIIGKKKGAGKPWKLPKEKRTIPQLVSGENSAWCLDASGIATGLGFSAAEVRGRKRDPKLGGLEDGNNLSPFAAAPESTYDVHSRSFVVRGAAASSGSGEGEVAKPETRRPQRIDASRRVPQHQELANAGAQDMDASFQVRAVQALMSSPISAFKSSLRLKSESPDSSVMISGGGAVAAATSSKMNRQRPNTAALESTNRYCDVAGGGEQLLNINSNNQSPTATKVVTGIEPGARKSLPGDLSKHIMEALRDRNSKGVRSRTNKLFDVDPLGAAGLPLNGNIILVSPGLRSPTGNDKTAPADESNTASAQFSISRRAL